jgi:hypothetical protein
MSLLIILILFFAQLCNVLYYIFSRRENLNFKKLQSIIKEYAIRRYMRISYSFFCRFGSDFVVTSL